MNVKLITFILGSLLVLKIQLINTREEYEVYRLHNLPFPMHRVLPNQTDILLKYI